MIKRCSVFVFLLLVIHQFTYSQKIPDSFQNPIIPGYHPDPSICRVDNDYYLVNSTFVWYPGLPIYHSKDLVNWELIGYGIHRLDQLDFEGVIDKFGAFAATIRYHEGVFYIINTCVACGGNFYITATNPKGPWSDPVWIKDAPGIDPSLMWDDDGKCYYTGHMRIEEQVWPTQCGIWTQELDLDQQKLIGRREILTNGHANNASYTEGPHLYKINGKYLLMVSEGGTGTNHSLTVHHSDSLWGPYITDMVNPVITHRHLGRDYPIHSIGHGDLIETQNGEWWCVTLGKRNIEGKVTLGRETFLAKVVFEGQTPIFNPGYGKILAEQKRPNLPWTPIKEIPARDDFNADKLGLQWNFIRVPKEKFYAIENGKLTIELQPEVVDSLVNSSMIIQRIVNHRFNASTKVYFKTAKKNEQAGLIIYRTNKNHFLLLKEKNDLVLIRNFKGVKEIIARVPYDKPDVIFQTIGNNLDVVFKYGSSLEDMKQIGTTQDLTVISDGNGNQFNGPGVGVYATSNGKNSSKQASFDWFEYKGE